MLWNNGRAIARFPTGVATDGESSLANLKQDEKIKAWLGREKHKTDRYLKEKKRRSLRVTSVWSSWCCIYQGRATGLRGSTDKWMDGRVDGVSK